MSHHTHPDPYGKAIAIASVDLLGVAPSVVVDLEIRSGHWDVSEDSSLVAAGLTVVVDLGAAGKPAAAAVVDSDEH